MTHAQWCRLSQVFNGAADLRIEDDRVINEWLKEQIRLARSCRRCDFSMNHDLHYAGTVDGHQFDPWEAP